MRKQKMIYTFEKERNAMSHIKIIFICWVTLFLSACSSLNSEFECQMKPGIRCESLDQISTRVNRGEINKYSSLTSSCCGSSPAKDSSCTNYSNSRSTLSNVSLYKSWAYNSSLHEPLRYGETVQHVWVAPFEDTAGNYHQESDIYTIVKPGHWIGNPPKEFTNDEG